MGRTDGSQLGLSVLLSANKAFISGIAGLCMISACLHLLL